jgi:acetyl-CoA carboxylase carboxyltransferase component
MTHSQDSQKLQADQMLQAAHDPEHYRNMGMLDAVIPFDTLRQEIIHFIRAHQDGGRASKKAVPAI